MKLVLFDIDGTLMLSKGAGREATVRAMREVFGTEGTVRQMSFGGMTDWSILNGALASEGYTPEQVGLRIHDFARAMARHMAEVLPHYEVFALQGGQELVAHFKARSDVLVGVVTGNTQLSAPVKLRHAGYDPQDFVVGAYGNEAYRRNDLTPLALERARRYSGVAIAPQDVWVIGDTVMDIECARVIGANAVAVLTGFEDPQALADAQPDYLLPDLTHFQARIPL